MPFNKSVILMNSNKVLFYIIFLFLFQKINAQNFRLQRPVPENVQVYGNYLYGEERFWDANNAHRGIDLWISYDTVYSASNGIVNFIGYNANDTTGGYEPNGFGNYIRVKSKWNHKDIYIYYAHLTKPIVALNKNIIKGEPIAISGNTGNSTGPHLHFEIRENTYFWNAKRNRRNPELWFAKDGMGAIYGNVPNASDNTRINISPDPKPRPPYTTFAWAETYKLSDPTISGDDIYNENYAIGDVKPGTYTITALNGNYKRIVTVKAGEVVNADATTLVERNQISEKFILLQNYPNPFNPTTTIQYTVPVAVKTLHATSQLVKLIVYDALGKKVASLVDKQQVPGNYKITFDAKELAGGVYFYQLLLNNIIETKKMILVK